MNVTIRDLRSWVSSRRIKLALYARHYLTHAYETES